MLLSLKQHSIDILFKIFITSCISGRVNRIDPICVCFRLGFVRPSLYVVHYLTSYRITIGNSSCSTEYCCEILLRGGHFLRYSTKALIFRGILHIPRNHWNSLIWCHVTLHDDFWGKKAKKFWRCRYVNAPGVFI